MNITIKEKPVTLKFSFRALMMYENITGKTFSPSGLADIITFFYCIVLVSSNDYTISYEQFLDWMDANPDAINKFAEWIKTNIVNQNQLKKG